MYKITNISADPRRIRIDRKERIIASGEFYESTNAPILDKNVWRIDDLEKKEKKKTKVKEVKEYDSNSS